VDYNEQQCWYLIPIHPVSEYVNTTRKLNYLYLRLEMRVAIKILEVILS